MITFPKSNKSHFVILFIRFFIVYKRDGIGSINITSSVFVIRCLTQDTRQEEIEYLKINVKTEKHINVINIITIVIKMISIIKKGHWNILRIFYENKSERFHLREIARKAKLHEPSTSKFLRDLEKDNILKSKKNGNQKEYSLKYNSKTFQIFQLFDFLKFEELPSIRKNAINYFFKELKEKPLIMFIFGSTAKKTFNENSDIDILLITNSKINTEEAEKNSEALTGIKISVFQMNLNQFYNEVKLKKDLVIQSAIGTGYPIFNNIFYYEVIYN